MTDLDSSIQEFKDSRNRFFVRFLAITFVVLLGISWVQYIVEVSSKTETVKNDRIQSAATLAILVNGDKLQKYFCQLDPVNSPTGGDQPVNLNTSIDEFFSLHSEFSGYYILYRNDAGCLPPSSGEYIFAFNSLGEEFGSPYNPLITGFIPDFEISGFYSNSRTSEQFDFVTSSPIQNNAGKLVGAAVLSGSTSTIFSRARWVLFQKIAGTLIVIFLLAIVSIRKIKQDIKKVERIKNSFIGLLDEQNDELNFTARELVDLTEQLDKIVIDRTKALQQSNKKLKASNEELERFARVASHDMKEPLRMIASYLQLLKRRYGDDLDDSAQEYIHTATAASRRLQIMINELLDYARMDRMDARDKPVNLNILLSEALDFLEVSLSESNAKVHYQEELPVVFGKETLLLRLFQNLISNSIKFRDPERVPSIIISSKEGPSGFFQISIQDNGIGISKEYHQKIFQVFERLHSRNEFEGHGLGLASCKKIVELHGGRIWVDSSPGKGTTFNFTLPEVEPEGSNDSQSLGEGKADL